MLDCTTIAIEGNRVVRVGTYRLDNGDGEPPELRVFLAPGWASSPPLPFGPDMVDIPASALERIQKAFAKIQAQVTHASEDVPARDNGR